MANVEMKKAVDASALPLVAFERTPSCFKTRFDQNLIVLGLGFGYLFELKHIERTVSRVHDGFHEYSSTVMTTFPFLCPLSTYL